MSGLTFTLVLTTGVLLAGGLVAVVVAFVPRHPHLLDAVGGLQLGAAIPGPREAGDLIEPGGRSERLGSWLARRTPVPLTSRQRQNLSLRGRSVSEFYADKAALAVVGLVLPSLIAVAWSLLLGGVSPPVPVLAALAGALLGWFVPDLMLTGQAKASRTDAGAALLTYIDLVTLERLANASATQALHNAANLSEVPLFRQIRAALERARLEQQPPFLELRRLAGELNLPELVDLADVMQLDESGAALSQTLRARVRELRDAHLAGAQREANAVSESMTVYMTIPALIFGLIFMVPPLMRIVGS